MNKVVEPKLISQVATLQCVALASALPRRQQFRAQVLTAQSSSLPGHGRCSMGGVLSRILQSGL